MSDEEAVIDRIVQETGYTGQVTLEKWRVIFKVGALRRIPERRGSVENAELIRIYPQDSEMFMNQSLAPDELAAYKLAMEEYRKHKK